MCCILRLFLDQACSFVIACLRVLAGGGVSCYHALVQVALTLVVVVLTAMGSLVSIPDIWWWHV